MDGFGLKWALQSGVTPSLGTGPSRDHTTGTKEGSYIYLEYVFLNDLRVRGKSDFFGESIFDFQVLVIVWGFSEAKNSETQGLSSWVLWSG